MLTAVRGHGFFRSEDGGRTWTKIAGWPQDLLEFDNPRQAFSIGWCPDKKLVYCAFLGGDAYRAEWMEME
jgi:hypothetical protein